MKVEEIAEAIAKLPPDQLARFRRWFAAFEVGRSDHAKETARSGRSCLAARDWTIVIPPQAIAGNDHTEASKLLLTGSPKFALARRLPMGENRDCYHGNVILAALAPAPQRRPDFASTINTYCCCGTGNS